MFLNTAHLFQRQQRSARRPIGWVEELEPRTLLAAAISLPLLPVQAQAAEMATTRQARDIGFSSPAAAQANPAEANAPGTGGFTAQELAATTPPPSSQGPTAPSSFTTSSTRGQTGDPRRFQQARFDPAIQQLTEDEFLPPDSGLRFNEEINRRRNVSPVTGPINGTPGFNQGPTPLTFVLIPATLLPLPPRYGALQVETGSNVGGAQKEEEVDDSEEITAAERSLLEQSASTRVRSETTEEAGNGDQTPLPPQSDEPVPPPEGILPETMPILDGSEADAAFIEQATTPSNQQHAGMDVGNVAAGFALLSASLAASIPVRERKLASEDAYSDRPSLFRW